MPTTAELSNMRLLIVDDSAIDVAVLEDVLADAGYTTIQSTDNPYRAIELCATWHPDLVLLDLHMPGFDGFHVLAELRDLIVGPVDLAVAVLTGNVTTEARNRCLSLGARDFVNKPFDLEEILLRIGNLLHTRYLQQRLRERNARLADAVRQGMGERDQARLEAINLLAAAGEYRDDETHQHTQRVGRSAALIAQTLGLTDETVVMIRDAAPLHDIGKIGIPDDILLKPGPLTDEERSIMQRHVQIGARILAPARAPLLRAAAEIARTHHERWDGNGYMLGLRGNDIPLAGRITAVADVFDALTHERPYKAAWPLHEAVAEIERQAGKQFDPRVVDAFSTLDHASLLTPVAPVDHRGRQAQQDVQRRERSTSVHRLAVGRKQDPQTITAT